MKISQPFVYLQFPRILYQEQSVHQRQGDVLNQVVVLVPAGQVDSELQRQRARHHDLVFEQPGRKTYSVSPGLALAGLKVIRFSVRSALRAPSVFS